MNVITAKEEQMICFQFVQKSRRKPDEANNLSNDVVSINECNKKRELVKASVGNAGKEWEA